MKKVISFSLFVLTVSILSFSAEKNSKPVLKFNTDRKFKIVQFTDTHFEYNSSLSDSVLSLIRKVVKAEKPDLVVFTGDVVISTKTRLAWLSFSKVMIEAKVPWAVTLGNHDTERELTGDQIMEIIVGMPYSMTENGPENISGNGNYILKIQASKSSETAATLLFFDSHGHGNYIPGQEIKWDNIKFDQIEWYREHSNNLTKANGGTALPALAFFHIPLPEYKEIKRTSIGIHEETVTPSEINSGLYAAMIECKDVMGVFVGHNHNNNFIGCLRNICLAYGNVTGRECYGKIGRGSRVIELYEGERKFDTWVLKLYECDREKDTWFPARDYQRKFFVTYPDSFINLVETGADSYIEFMNNQIK
jgi:predicted MPP superfamily phosphohydrolase